MFRGCVNIATIQIYMKTFWCRLAYIILSGWIKLTSVKRETGVIPVRSRHCDKGNCGFMYVTGVYTLGRQSRSDDLSAGKPAICWYRDIPRITSNWSYCMIDIFYLSFYRNYPLSYDCGFFC